MVVSLGCKLALIFHEERAAVSEQAMGETVGQGDPDRDHFQHYFSMVNKNNSAMNRGECICLSFESLWADANAVVTLRSWFMLIWGNGIEPCIKPKTLSSARWGNILIYWSVQVREGGWLCQTCHFTKTCTCKHIAILFCFWKRQT